MCDCVDSERLIGVIGPLMNAIIKHPDISHVETKVEMNNNHGLSVEVICHGHKNWTYNNKQYYYTRVATFSLTEMPGCCGILVSHNTYVEHDFRRKGIATKLMEAKEAIAKSFKYGQLQATVVVDNIIECNFLRKNEFKQVDTFKNPKTNNNLLIFTKDLR